MIKTPPILGVQFPTVTLVLNCDSALMNLPVGSVIFSSRGGVAMPGRPVSCNACECRRDMEMHSGRLGEVRAEAEHRQHHLLRGEEEELADESVEKGHAAADLGGG